MQRSWNLLAVATACQLCAAEVMRAGALVRKPWDLRVHLEDFREIRAAVPAPARGEVLVRVEGTSVNPCEWKVLEFPLGWAYSYPRIAGHDVSGTVVAVGDGVSRLRPGDQVWGFSEREGAHAEYVAVAERNLGHAPTRIPLAEAGSMPLVALTNLQAFKWAGGPWQGRNYTVVVLGGSGGTGHTAIQMARAWGATTVITTCGTNNVDFCKSLGADQVIDYHKEEWYQVLPPESVDFVYDTVGRRATGDLAYPVIRSGGAFVTILSEAVASDATAGRHPSVKQTFNMLSHYSHAELDVLAALVDQGQLAPRIGRTFGLAEIAQAFNASLLGHSVGKGLVLPAKV